MKTFWVRRFCCAATGALVLMVAARVFSQPAGGDLDVEVRRDPRAASSTRPSRPEVSQPTAPAQMPASPAWSGEPGVAYEPAQTMVPPGVEGQALASAGGGYCYVGPHPSDTRVMPGDAWDPTEGQHLRPYAPVDLRLFSYRAGCYYFIGDPRDFGYGGQVSSYYGAHPVLASYGGGWCFMMGGHSHVWSPWSPYFTVVGPWYYWRGPYDPFFWTYWPYYSTYYRAYYPHYYGGGRFYRGGGYQVAPAFGRGGFRGQPAGGGFAPAVRGAAGWQPSRGAPSAAGTGPVYPGPTVSPGPRMMNAAPAARSFAPPSGGGFRGGGSRGGRR